MRSSHNLATWIETTFDEDNLVANAGLIAPGALAQKLGGAELIDEHLHLPDRVEQVVGTRRSAIRVATGV